MPNQLAEIAAIVELHLNTVLPASDNQLDQALRYSCLAGGKRLRPYLLIKLAEILGVKLQYSLTAACAIELIHNYSLIHDDLPAMDDDDLRRGQPSCHKKFDEATAILAGDALLTLAFEILATSDYDNDIIVALTRIIAQAAGKDGMIAGQMLDLHPDTTINQTYLLKTQALKTGAMFKSCAHAAAILGQASESEYTALTNFAANFGITFQIRDDLNDYAQDQAAGNTSFATIFGREAAEQKLVEIAATTKSDLQIFEDKAADLLAFCDQIFGTHSTVS